jgi:hypothetical protein
MTARPNSVATLALRIACWALALVILSAAGLPARAQQTEVDLQLALMVDASGSVDQYRFDLQKRGYVAALRNKQVLDAVQSGPNGSIAITMVQWTGAFLQVQVLPWTQIKDQASIMSAAALVERFPRRLFGGGTSVSGAIDHAMMLFPQSPFKGARRVIDISGDGSNNTGRSVTRARDEAVAQGVVINGLPILAVEPYLDRYFKDFVIGGPGAFMIAVENFEQFGDAILKKMILEIAANERQFDGGRPVLR